MSVEQRKNLLKLPAGEIIDGRFEISGNPVRRNFGVAYLAIDMKSSKRRTLLFLPPAVFNDAEAMEYIRDEAKLIRWINHPFIARLYELHEEGDFTYFELEYVRGKSLKDKKIANPQKRLSENITKWLGIQILEALAYAHDQNILHRDIKPQNVVLTADGKVKLIDFGISETLRFAVSMIRDTSGQTSILYMSPEQLSGKQMSPQSDIYSVAATMYDLVSSKPPFFYGDVYTQILREEAKAITGVSSDLNSILLKALAKDPQQRYGSCKEMIKDLHISGVQMPRPVAPDAEKTSAKKAKKREKGFRFFSLNPTLKYLFGTVFIVLVMVFLAGRLKDIPGKFFSQNKQTEAAGPDSTQVRMIQAFLKLGNEKMGAGKLVKPADNNALELFRQVLKIAPRQKEAKLQIDRIKNKLARDIRRRQRAGDSGKALALVNEALSFFPADSVFVKLKKQIPEFAARIAILNGAGVKGIAGKLAEGLKAEGYSVVYVENYRVRGRINWNVRKTRFTGKVSENENIKKIASDLGLAYRQNPRENSLPDGANLVIILGKDYRRLRLLQTK